MEDAIVDNNHFILANNNDVIIGTEENNTLYGNEGNDSIDGGEGNNTLYGGMGDDTLINTFGYVSGDLGYDILIADYSNYETAIQNIDYRNQIETIDNELDLINFYSIENYQIIGTAFNDSFQGSSNDSLDGGAGIDKLSLDFSGETESIVIDLTNTDNQVTFGDTQVSNFETIDYIYGGSNDDTITLGLSASISGGYVYGGWYGDDTLVLDYSSYETAIQNLDNYSYVRRVDNDVDLVNFSGIEQYQITGTQYDDSLQGSSNSDTLIGGSGDDEIRGNSGDDILIGVNSDLENAGIDEIDTLVGGSGSDSFLLGNIDFVFYDDGEYTTQGIEDYALIQDFDLREDTIEISGSKSNYRLGFSPIIDITGTAIYRVENGYYNRELIAIIEDVFGLNINSDFFKEIANSAELEPEPEPVEEEIEPTLEPEPIEEEIEPTPEPEPVEEEIEPTLEPEPIEEEIEPTPEPEPEPVEEEIEPTPEPEPEFVDEDDNAIQLNAYQISRLSVGLEINNSDFVGLESNFVSDINQDGVVSAFDAYLAYSAFDEI